MPTYEYRCPDGHHFELFQKMSEEPRAACPECGAMSERILSGGAGFLFKGDGFYATDYRSDSYKKDASKEESAAKTGEAKSTGDKKGTADKSTPSKAKNTSPETPSGGGHSSKGS